MVVCGWATSGESGSTSGNLPGPLYRTLRAVNYLWRHVPLTASATLHLIHVVTQLAAAPPYSSLEL
jgi:hypothetical protein